MNNVFLTFDLIKTRWSYKSDKIGNILPYKHQKHVVKLISILRTRTEIRIPLIRINHKVKNAIDIIFKISSRLSWSMIDLNLGYKLIDVS